MAHLQILNSCEFCLYELVVLTDVVGQVISEAYHYSQRGL